MLTFCILLPLFQLLACSRLAKPEPTLPEWWRFWFFHATLFVPGVVALFGLRGMEVERSYVVLRCWTTLRLRRKVYQNSASVTISHYPH